MSRLTIIPVDSLAAWWAQWDRYCVDRPCRNAAHPSGEHTPPPESLLAENDALFDGRAVLELPDGRRYRFAPDPETLSGPDAAWLALSLVEHGAIRHERVLRHHEVMLDIRTGSLRTAWCLECHDFVDLEAEMVEAKCMEAAGKIQPIDQPLEPLDDD